MFTRTINLYRNAYTGLTPATWWLSLVMLVNRSGTMVLPFMTIYLTSPQMGYSLGQAGIVMGFFGLGAVAGAYLGGKLTDRIGFYTVQLAALFCGGLLFIILGQMRSYPLICLFTFLLSLINDAFRPANSTAIAAYSREDNRTRSYALNRLSINLGWALGSAAGGILASIRYELLFWVDGITNIVAAVLLWYFLRPYGRQHAPAAQKKVTVTGQSAYRDIRYLWFILFTVLFAACFFQLFTNLTAYYKIQLHFSESLIGILGAINGLLIALIEMVLVFQLEGRRSSLYYISRGVLLCGMAYLLLNLFTINAVLSVVMMLLITLGEILSLPFMNTFWISRSGPANRGQYAALYTMAWSAAQTFGPSLGSLAAERWGFTTLWWAAAFLCLVASCGFMLLGHRKS